MTRGRRVRYEKGLDKVRALLKKLVDPERVALDPKRLLAFSTMPVAKERLMKGCGELLYLGGSRERVFALVSERTS